MKKRKIKKFFGYPYKPRISVYRSNKEIYAQIIDDVSGKTLVYSSSIDQEFLNFKKLKKTKIELSYEVGKSLGLKAKKINIDKVVFNKGKYLYHGRIKSLSIGIRDSGLKF
ncbi:50S ribosomal protein L18 [Blattabacterium cuenoti]|uniref:50S ribosomal protein L18 n=1 Tax=Blattabacterium cuenoti TaxID=1653831 RepID=UPI00163CCA98|nr:50S ribosomal protein L18 [Blattabacterium cuenoti]